MFDGRRALIHLLDEQCLEIVIQPRLFVDELLSIVASHVSLKDPDRQYFGIAYVDESGQYHWLPKERRVLEFDFPRKAVTADAYLELYHNVRFFIESVISLHHPATVELFFFEAKNQLCAGLLELPEVDYYNVVANFLHILDGDFTSDVRARSVLESILPISARLLSKYAITRDECERNIFSIYKELRSTRKGSAIINFMQIAEHSPTYGSRFYEVRDKSGSLWSIAINNRGIFQYDPSDMSKPRKVFTWRLLDNLYYRDRKFSIEVRDPRRVVQSTSDLQTLVDSNGGPFDVDDDLAKAVNDPTTQVSLTRRAIAPSSVYVHTFFCETPFLCKTLWSAAIAQHQFYLDQRTKANSKRTLQSQQTGLDLYQLSEKLSRLISQSSIGSSLPSLSSLNSLSGGMRSAKIADGSCTSLPSLNSAYSQKSEEEKQKDIELYRELKQRKNELEEKLLAKLEELREVCIKEAEITGEMPKEIYKTLMPGEPEPKVKRRVGTAFCLSEDVFRKPADGDEKLVRLETDVELHRKIVAAAERLAKDKSMNKSVRRKRQKDLLAAMQKLKGLELGLNQLRLSASKPDVSTTDRANTTGKRLWKGYTDHTATSGMSRTGGSLIAKSCPTTPRGSIPDLSTTDNEKSDAETDDDLTPRRPNGRCAQRVPSFSTQSQCIPSRFSIDCSTSSAPHSTSALPPAPNRKPALPMTKLVANMQLHNSLDVNNRSSSDDLDNPLEVTIRASATPTRATDSASHLPIYENVGYKSCASYKSSYRETNFPTLNDMCKARTRVPRAHSEHTLPRPEQEASVSTSLSNNDFSAAYHDSLHHDAAATCSSSHQPTSWSGRRIQKDSTREGDPYDVDNVCTVSAWNDTIESGSRALPSDQRLSVSRCSSGTRNGGVPNKRIMLPTSHCSASGIGIDTASLDRRAIRNRQHSYGSITKYGIDIRNMERGRTASDGNDRVSIPTTSESQLISRLSPLSAPRVTTTFPVAHATSLMAVQTSKPFETVDLQRYQQRSSPLISRNILGSPSPKRIIPTGSLSPHRPPPPSYTNALRVTANGVVLGNGSPLAKVTPANTDPHMEALSDYYKDATYRKGKTATIV